MLLVHNKSSRLAVIGELGRYPLFVRALAHTLKYSQTLVQKPEGELISHAVKEMAAQGHDCWLYRTQQINRLLKMPVIHQNKQKG